MHMFYPIQIGSTTTEPNVLETMDPSHLILMEDIFVVLEKLEQDDADLLPELDDVLINSILLPIKSKGTILSLYHEFSNNRLLRQYELDYDYSFSGKSKKNVEIILDNEYNVNSDGNITNCILVNAQSVLQSFGPKFCEDVYNNSKIRPHSDYHEKVIIINSIYAKVCTFVKLNGFTLVRTRWFLSDLFTNDPAIKLYCSHNIYEFTIEVYTYTSNKPDYFTLSISQVNKQSVEIGNIYTTCCSELVDINPSNLEYFKILLNSSSIKSYCQNTWEPMIDMISTTLMENSIKYKIIKNQRVNLNSSSLDFYFKIDGSKNIFIIIPYIDNSNNLSIMFWHGYSLQQDLDTLREIIHHKCVFDKSTFVSRFSEYQNFMSGEYEYSDIYPQYFSKAKRDIKMGIYLSKTNLFKGDLINVKEIITESSSKNYAWKVQLKLKYNPQTSPNVILKVVAYYTKKCDMFIRSIIDHVENKYETISSFKIEGSYDYCNSAIAHIKGRLTSLKNHNKTDRDGSDDW